jgi:hypothetical protein
MGGGLVPVRKLSVPPLQPDPPVYLGIDPGVGGGLAWIAGRNKVDVAKMPATETDLWDLLETIAGEMNLKGGFALLEQQSARPTIVFDHKTKKFRPTILKSTCVLYGGYRLLKGMLVAAGIPHEECPPQRWQKAMNIPPREKGEPEQKWKNRLKARAQALFPGVTLTLATCDALLIAEAARRSKQGGGDGAGAARKVLKA